MAADGSALAPSSDFDWRNPDYDAVFRERIERLAWLRRNAHIVPQLRAYYAESPADFIDDWGCTYDPRNIEVGLPALIPMRLFPKQRDLCAYIMRKWGERRPGLIEKSRDVGMSWLVIGVGVCLCANVDGFTAGYGSRKEEYVDKSGDPKSLFWKAREFIKGLPREFRGG